MKKQIDELAEKERQKAQLHHQYIQQLQHEIEMIRHTTDLLPSVMPLGCDRFGNAYYVFPRDYNYLYIRVTEKSETEMRERQNNTNILTFNSNISDSQKEFTNSYVLHQFDTGEISERELNGRKYLVGGNVLYNPIEAAKRAIEKHLPQQGKWCVLSDLKDISSLCEILNKKHPRENRLKIALSGYLDVFK